MATPSHAPSALGPAARDAFDILHAADVFEDAHVGYDGHLSRGVAAFRVVLADPSASVGFHALVADALPAGRLYGVAGLYFADPPAFDAALAQLTKTGGNVRRQQGCEGDEEAIATVIRSNAQNAIVVSKGATLSSWFAAHPKGGVCDLAGGCVSLMFVADDRPAPR